MDSAATTTQAQQERVADMRRQIARRPKNANYLRSLERRGHMFSLRIEPALMARLRDTSNKEGVSASDKARTILNAALPASA